MDAPVTNDFERMLQLSNLLLNAPVSIASHSKLDILKLLDAFLVLYDECKRLESGKGEEHLKWFLDTYANVFSQIRALHLNAVDFETIVKIGSGRFGTVSVVKEVRTGKHFALKIMKKIDIFQQLDVACFRAERDIMAETSSPWLTVLHYAFQDPGNLYLVMDFYPGGCLSNLLEHFGGRLKEEMARFYLAELLLALRSLHDMGYVHRDVKPDNILIDSGGHLKLADFGSAARLNSSGNVTDCFPVGSAEYVAPEVLNAVESVGCSFQENGYGIECDYWSFGIVAFELVFGSTPFIGENDMQTQRNVLCHEQYFSFPKDVNLSAEIMDIICKLVTNATCRICADDLLKHVFFREVNWDNQINCHPPYIPTVDSPTDTSNFDKITKIVPPVSSSRKLKQFSDVLFVGFTFSRALLGSSLVKLSEFSLDCKITDLQDCIHVLDTSSRQMEKLHIGCLLEKRELVRRLKCAQEMCAVAEEVTLNVIRKTLVMWEKQNKYEKDQMAAKIEKLEKQLGETYRNSLVKCESKCVGTEHSSIKETVDVDKCTFYENYVNKINTEEKETQVEAVMTELNNAKAELMKVTCETKANQSKLSQIYEMEEKLKSSLDLEKHKCDFLIQELELCQNRRAVFTAVEYERILNAVVKLQEKFGSLSQDELNIGELHIGPGACSEMVFSREGFVEVVSKAVDSICVVGKILMCRSSVVDVEVNTDCAISVHESVQTEYKTYADSLLGLQPHYQFFEMEHLKSDAKLHNMSNFEAEIKRLADANQEHVKTIKQLREENHREASAREDLVRTCMERDMLREQLCKEKARVLSCTEELESFKKLFLEKNAEAHCLKKRLEVLERELHDESGACGCDEARDSCVLVQAVRQLRDESQSLRAANATLVNASAELEDQVDRYHSMLAQLQSQLVLSRTSVRFQDS